MKLCDLNWLWLSNLSIMSVSDYSRNALGELNLISTFLLINKENKLYLIYRPQHFTVIAFIRCAQGQKMGKLNKEKSLQEQ